MSRIGFGSFISRTSVLLLQQLNPIGLFACIFLAQPTVHLLSFE